MPYPRQEPIPLKEHVYLFANDVEKLQVAVTKVRQERNMWKHKYLVLNLEYIQISNYLKMKDEILEILKQHETQGK